MPRIGLSNLHYALLTSDTKEGATYEKPEHVTMLAKAKTSPKTNSKTYYADNGPVVSYNAMGEIELEIEVGSLPIEVAAKWLGASIKNGVMINKSTDQGPELAIGFEGLKANGKRVFYWYYKGKFSVPEEDLKTLEDSPDFQPETIKGVFVKRIFDNAWRAKAEEDGTGFDPATATGWYTKVYEESTPTGE